MVITQAGECRWEDEISYEVARMGWVRRYCEGNNNCGPSCVFVITRRRRRTGTWHFGDAFGGPPSNQEIGHSYSAVGKYCGHIRKSGVSPGFNVLLI